MLWCCGNPISSRQIVELISILNFDRPPPGDKLFDSRGEAERSCLALQIRYPLCSSSSSAGVLGKERQVEIARPPPGSGIRCHLIEKQRARK